MPERTLAFSLSRGLGGRALVFLVLAGGLPLFGAATAACAAGDGLSGKPVGDIRLPALKYTREELVRDALVSKAGEPFREENRGKDLEMLDRLGIFSFIDIGTSEEGGEVVLDIDLKETFPYLPTLSADISDEDGLTAGLGAKALNLMGRGISFSGAIRSGEATTAEFTLQNPWLPGGSPIYKAELFYRDRHNDLDHFDEKSLETSLWLGRTIGGHSRAGLLLSYLAMESDVDGITISADNRDNLRAAGVFLGFDSRDKLSYTTRGWWSELNILKAGGALGGDADFWRVVFDLRRYQPVRPRHTLALFGAAVLQSGEVGEDIPVYLDFHIGGTNSVRGWDLGSRRGKNELLGTAEYRFLLREPRIINIFSLTAHLGLELSLFADVGTVWDEDDGSRASNTIGGVGMGFRLIVPYVNVVRFDVGFGESGGGISLHIGGYEQADKKRERIR